MFDYTKEHVVMTKKGFDDAPISNLIATPGHILALGVVCILTRELRKVPDVTAKIKEL